MAVETENTGLYAAQVSKRWQPQAAIAEKAFKMFFEHTQGTDGDANSLVNLCKLPPGKVRVLIPECRVRHAAISGATLDIGHLAYTGRDGSAVAADVDSLADALNIASAGTKAFNESNDAKDWIDFESTDGVTIQAKVLSAGIDSGETLKGYITYLMLA